MEREFPLHRNQPLTVEVIQEILAQRITPIYSPDPIENLNEVAVFDYEAISPAELQAFAIGLGSETPAELTPLMLLLLADFFSKNPGAKNPQIISRILEFYTFDVFPQIFSQGLYASPTAHILLPVFGAGKVYYQGYILKATDVHDIFSWQLVPWPNTLPRALTTASFLGLSNLLYCFIQFKQIFRYSQELLPATNTEPDSGDFFYDRINHLETQINDYLVNPEAPAKHLNGLVYQAVKLFNTFGEHIFENLSRPHTNSDNSFVLNSPVYLNSGHLLALLEVLSQENLVMFEGNFDINPGPSTSFTNRLMMQPYLFLKNLEKVMAVTTLLQLTKFTGAENTINESANFRSTYRKQVIDVLQEANFDELIRKTIAFLYARVSSK